MRTSPPTAVGAVLLLLLLAVLSPLSSTPVTALISQLHLEHDTRAAFHIESFGYEQGGVFHVEISNLVRRVPDDTPVKDTYEIAFVLQRSNSDAPVRLSAGASTAGPADKISIDKVTSLPIPTGTGTGAAASAGAGSADAEPVVSIVRSTLLDSCFHRDSLEGGEDANVILKLDRRDAWKHLVYERKITVPGFYHLYFSNCEPMSSVSLDVELEQYNVNADGERMYLSAGERHLPSLLLVLAALFVLELVAWLTYLRRHAEHVKTIHWLMLACVLVKAISIAVEAAKYQNLKATGKHDGWYVAYYIASSLKGILLFCVIVLLAVGWSHVKPFLTDRDKTLLLVTVTVQSLVNIALVVVGETPQGSVQWVSWHDMLSILDMLCWCVILLPIVWSIRALRDQAREDERKGERAARNMLRLQSFRSFYLLVIGFVYFTRIVVFLLAITLPFEQTWLSTMFAEAAALVFYGFTGYLFRPVSANAYLPLEVDENEMLEMQLDQEEEELELERQQQKQQKQEEEEQRQREAQEEETDGEEV